MSFEEDDLRFSELEECSDGEDSDLDDVDLQQGLKGADDDETDLSLSASKSKPKVTGIKHLLDMKEALGLDKFQSRKAKQKERRQKAKARKKLLLNKSDKIIQTLASKSKSSSSGVTKPTVVVYEDPRKRKKKRLEMEQERGSGSAKIEQPSRPGLDKGLDVDGELSMKQARFDVFNFGIKGFGKAAKEDAEIAQLIRLGAKPAKKKCIAYAELKEQRKREREEEKERKEMQRLSGMKSKSLLSRKSVGKKKSATSTSKAKKKSGAGETFGKVGKFDGGMLKISAKDLAKVRAGK